MSAYYRTLIQSGAQVLAHFPLSSHLLDVVSGVAATFSRSTAKTAFTDGMQALQILPANTPAFRDGGILIEQADTNNLIQSANLATWVNEVGSAVVSNVLAAPTGVVEADTLQYRSGRYRSLLVSANVKFLFSAFVHRTAMEAGALLILNASGKYIVAKYFFNDLHTEQTIDSGWAADSEFSITPMSNDWFLIGIRTSYNATTGIDFVLRTDIPADTAGDILGWWGMHKQARIGSPIPTTTVAVTRTADVLTVGSAQLPYAVDRTIHVRVQPNFYETGKLFTNGAFTVARNYTTSVWSLTIHQTGQVLNITGSPSDLISPTSLIIAILPDGKVTFDVQSILGPPAVTSTLPITGAIWADVQLGTTYNGLFSDLAYISKAVTLDEAIALV